MTKDGKYQVMPPLSPEEYEALKADIAARGVLVPVEYDEEGNILDGFHRVRACEELGIHEWPSIVRLGLTEAEKRVHARKLNLARRHVSRAQRRELIKGQLRESPEMSDRQIAAVLGVSHPTVSAVRREMVAQRELENLTSSLEADGKVRPRQVERKPAVFATSPAEMHRMVKAVAKVSPEVLPKDKVLGLSHLARAVGQIKREQAALAQEERQKAVAELMARQGIPMTPGQEPGVFVEPCEPDELCPPLTRQELDDYVAPIRTSCFPKKFRPIETSGIRPPKKA